MQLAQEFFLTRNLPVTTALVTHSLRLLWQGIRLPTFFFLSILEAHRLSQGSSAFSAVETRGRWPKSRGRAESPGPPMAFPTN